MRRIAILLTAALLAGACSSPTRSAPINLPPSNLTPPNGTPASSTPTLGVTAPDGTFDFTITKVEHGIIRVGAGELSKNATGRYSLVTLTVKNTSTEPRQLDASAQNIVDDQGLTYPADGEAAIYVNVDAEKFLNPIAPGDQVEGVIPFDVPTDVTPVAVELHDSKLSDGVWIKLP